MREWYCDICTGRKICLKESGFTKLHYSSLVEKRWVGGGGATEHIRRVFYYFFYYFELHMNAIVKQTPSGDENKWSREQRGKRLISCKHKCDGSSLEVRVGGKLAGSCSLVHLETKSWCLLKENPFLLVEKPHIYSYTYTQTITHTQIHVYRATHKSELVFIKATAGHQLP